MKHCILSLLFLVVSVCPALPAAVPDTLSIKALTASLDRAIASYDEYIALREGRIALLKEQLARTSPATPDYYYRNAELYQEYKAYICDSALHYLNRNLEWAEKYGETEKADETRIAMAHLLSSAGLYAEALEVIESIERQRLGDEMLPEYYNLQRHFYEELAIYTRDEGFRRRYFERSRCFDDSLMQLLPVTSPLSLERREMRAYAAGDRQEALNVNDIRLASAKEGTPQYALVTYHRSMHYTNLGNTEEAKRYLMLSALSDIRLAITDHASLWNLANLLYEEGDIERAYRYIRFSWDETNRYNARSRSIQSAGILSLIDLTYQAMGERQNDHLRFYIVLISALSLLLAGAIGYIYRQMKRLSVARNRLEQTNEQLQVSNHIKEEYIGRFMNLCSIYIKRLDSYRRMVNKKITSGQTEELLKIVRSQESQDSGLKELYENFDTAFLHLFPDFIEQFNELLLPEERIYPRKGELLTTELRIFALIRLGIDDSSQIAEFLRYSVNTIYNYRAKVKNKACGSREEFEKRLMAIR